MKKMISLFLVLMLAGCFMIGMEIPVQAASSSGYVYNLEKEEDGSMAAYISQYTGSKKTVTIPEKLGGYPVKGILENAFAENTTIQTVTIPEGVVSIGDHAFNKCTNLETVIIPESVTEIGAAAFCKCSSLHTVNLPKNLKELSSGIFQQCTSLEHIELPVGITQIPDSAFFGCSSLTRIAIPEGVTAIQRLSFWECSSLETVVLPKSLTAIRSNIFFQSDNIKTVVYCGTQSQWNKITMGEGNEEITDHLIAAPSSVTAVLTAHDDVKVSWSKVDGADGYAVYYKKSTASSYKLLGKTTSTSMKKADLADGVKYSFKVAPYVSVNGKKYISGTGESTNIYTLKKIDTPKVTKSSSKEVKVSWTDIPGQSGYQISQSESETGTNVVATWKTTDGTSMVVESGTKGQPYYYKVRAYKTVNGTKIYGPWSTPIKYTMQLAAPAEVKAVLYGYDDISVSWTKVSGASGYKVYYKKASASSYTYLKKTTETSAEIANLADGTKYTIKVVPYYQNGDTRYSSTNSQTASVYTLKKMGTPTVTQYSDSKVKVSWSDIPGQSGYQISKSTSKTEINIVYTYSSSSAEYKTITAKTGTTYYYKIRAYKTVSGKKIYGPWSDAASFKLK